MSKKKRSNLTMVFIVGALILVLLIAGRVVRARRAGTEYELYQVDTGTITRTVSGLGKVTALNKEIVFAPSGGQITSLNVALGDSVSKGDVLLRTAAGVEVKAPFDGEVTALFVKENEWINPGTRLAEVTDYHNLEVIAQVDELDIAKIAKGQAAAIDINALEDEELTGSITSIAREGVLQGGVTTFSVKVSIPDTTGLLLGMSAEIKVETQRAEGVIVVPMQAVLYENDQPYVLLQGERSSAVSQDVELGLNDGMYVEIKSGLSAGTTIMYEKKEDASQTRFGPGMRPMR